MITDPDAATVADLLSASRRAHLLYLQSLPRRAAQPGQMPQVQPGDPAEARRYLKDAATARAQAQRIDPDWEAPAWADDAQQGYPHDALLIEYLTALAS